MKKIYMPVDMSEIHDFGNYICLEAIYLTKSNRRKLFEELDEAMKDKEKSIQIEIEKGKIVSRPGSSLMDIACKYFPCLIY
jgi:hypothetical protein